MANQIVVKPYSFGLWDGLATPIWPKVGLAALGQTFSTFLDKRVLS